MDTDRYAVTASEKASTSRRLDVLVGSTGTDTTIDLSDRVLATTNDAIEARLAVIEDTLTRLADRLPSVADAEDRLATIEAKLSRLQDAVIDGLADVRNLVVEEVGGALTRLEHANAAVRASFGADLASVRVDLADALDEVRGQVESTVGAANSTIAATLEQHGAAAHSVLDAVQSEVKAGLGEMSRSLSGQLGAIRGVTGTLGGSTDRLVGAGQALLAYLGERDQWLEQERDRVLHDVLEEFAAGLSGRGRRSLTARMREVVDRRRDARDAERYRREAAGATVIEIPTVPAELAVLSEPIRPAEDADPGAEAVFEEATFRVVAGPTAAPVAEPARKRTAPKTRTKPAKTTSSAPKSASRSGGPATKTR